MSESIALSGSEKTRAYVELLKPRLSFLVAFSAGFGYLLATSTFHWVPFLAVAFGGFLVSGAAVIINQVMEIQYDAIMKRTEARPLPSDKLTKQEAVIFCVAVAIVGFGLLLWQTNLLTFLLAFLSLVLYSFVYTPAKRMGPIAVFIGAVPGALPPLLGWVAATGSIDIYGLIIFGIQFIWQFPHFWAIAWLADADYKKAGFKLLPVNGQRDFRTAVQIMIYTLFLIPIGLLPSLFGLTGIVSAFVTTVAGVAFLAQTFALMRDQSLTSARRIMFGSFLYLPIVQVTFLLDKI